MRNHKLHFFITLWIAIVGAAYVAGVYYSPVLAGCEVTPRELVADELAGQGFTDAANYLIRKGY